MAAADVRPPDEANWLVNPARRSEYAGTVIAWSCGKFQGRNRCAGQLKRRCLHGWCSEILLRASVPCTFDEHIDWHSRIEKLLGAFGTSSRELR